MSFKCVIVTPEAQALDAQVSQVILPAFDGQLGILTGRSPLLAKLGLGALRLDVVGGGRQSFFVEGGVAQMKGNTLTVLTNEAVPAAEIDPATARAEYAEAEARVATTVKEMEDRRRQMNRALAKQELAAEK